MDNNNLVLIVYNGEEVEVSSEVADTLAQDIRYLLAQQKKRKRHISSIEMEEGAIEDLLPVRPEALEDMVIRRLEAQRVRQAVANLPEIQKRRLIAYFFEGLTYRQIAEREGVNHMAVIRSVQSAIEKLKIMLS